MLEHFLNLAGAGLLAHHVNQANDIGLRRADALTLHDHRFGKPVALVELDAQILDHVVLLVALHLFGNQQRLRFGLGQLDKGAHGLGLEYRQVELDKRCQRQPAFVGTGQDGVVKCQTEATALELLQIGQVVGNFVHLGQGQRRYLQHHALGCYQVQVTTGEAVMGAVDEDGLAARQRVVLGHGQCVE